MTDRQQGNVPRGAKHILQEECQQAVDAATSVLRLPQCVVFATQGQSL
jgi:hypothetical protein